MKFKIIESTDLIELEKYVDHYIENKKVISHTYTRRKGFEILYHIVTLIVDEKQ